MSGKSSPRRSSSSPLHDGTPWQWCGHTTNCYPCYLPLATCKLLSSSAVSYWLFTVDTTLPRYSHWHFCCPLHHTTPVSVLTHWRAIKMEPFQDLWSVQSNDGFLRCQQPSSSSHWCWWRWYQRNMASIVLFIFGECYLYNQLATWHVHSEQHRCIYWYYSKLDPLYFANQMLIINHCLHSSFFRSACTATSVGTLSYQLLSFDAQQHAIAIAICNAMAAKLYPLVHSVAAPSNKRPLTVPIPMTAMTVDPQSGSELHSWASLQNPSWLYLCQCPPAFGCQVCTKSKWHWCMLTMACERNLCTQLQKEGHTYHYQPTCAQSLYCSLLVLTSQLANPTQALLPPPFSPLLIQNNLTTPQI